MRTRTAIAALGKLCPVRLDDKPALVPREGIEPSPFG